MFEISINLLNFLRKLSNILRDFYTSLEISKKPTQGCHGGAGQGIQFLAPPLEGSEWLTKSNETLIKIVLEGLMGPIKVAGKEYDLSMPPILNLSNKEVAEVLNYVRSTWAPSAEKITPEEVGRIRQGL